jgi:hypothetical protein
MTDYRQKSQRYLRKSVELRTRAVTVREKKARDTLMRLADDYEQIARTLQAIAFTTHDASKL